MDILIKNVSLPKEGEVCIVVHHTGIAEVYGVIAEPSFGTNRTCAIEVPHHGKLIDADLYKKYAVRVHNAEGKEYIPADYIDIVPTILEATE